MKNYFISLLGYYFRVVFFKSTSIQSSSYNSKYSLIRSKPDSGLRRIKGVHWIGFLNEYLLLILLVKNEYISNYILIATKKKTMKNGYYLDFS